MFAVRSLVQEERGRVTVGEAWVGFGQHGAALKGDLGAIALRANTKMVGTCSIQF